MARVGKKFALIEAEKTEPTVRSRSVPELLSEVLDRVRSIERRLAEREAEQAVRTQEMESVLLKQALGTFVPRARAEQVRQELNHIIHEKRLLRKALEDLAQRPDKDQVELKRVMETQLIHLEERQALLVRNINLQRAITAHLEAAEPGSSDHP